ncbi:hypothetical protein AVEN_55136-1 [Araneus ventricosus]|uniref:DDE Tnp4 domain-containing protein n=1 Tax=Araneus ventricosus TaxID=182803 RepID=A0A4Y2R582_ARAVE|nr:hypothetical protein AVEN_55136-1 [Araneus ventricosus]
MNKLKELQDSLGKKAFIPENISNDTQMKALTGFTKEMFSCVYSFLNVEVDLQTGNFFKRPVDIFFLFLVKLRTGISNEFLSVLFEISDSTISRYFTFVTTVLYEKLKLLHIFSSKSKVVESMPRQFYSENRDCRVIVDCNEFPIQKPNSPAEQQMTFSFYKNTNTLKGMIGIMPSGTISFISPLYCGSISYKELFIKSQLMDLLEPNDVVMADKGFQIEQDLQKISCKLKCPKFLNDCIQFDASDRIENCKISNGHSLIIVLKSTQLQELPLWHEILWSRDQRPPPGGHLAAQIESQQTEDNGEKDDNLHFSKRLEKHGVNAFSQNEIEHF